MIDEKKYKQYLAIESFKPTEQYKSPPNFKELFLYVSNDNKTFRAYRLPSNPVNNQAIRFFLLDIGTLMFVDFDPSRFYK